MKRIFFIHGLESSNKSSKVVWMQSKGFDVLAPSMDYTTNDSLFSQTLEKVLEFQPHLIVGSSMGGYFAHHIGTHYPSTLLLLNPALISRSFEPKIVPDGAEKSEVWALLGEQDDLISPIENFKILQNMGATIRMGKHGHRTPIKAFQGVFEELIKNNPL
jgi:pimeloyl-ACP methyl ester carboxylesterase